jgi:phosphatidylglycerophosphate synthase
VLVGITLVVSIISSLGAPLLPGVAKDLDISLPSAQWSLTAALIAGTLSAARDHLDGDGARKRSRSSRSAAPPASAPATRSAA